GLWAYCGTTEVAPFQSGIYATSTGDQGPRSELSDPVRSGIQRKTADSEAHAASLRVQESFVSTQRRNAMDTTSGTVVQGTRRGWLGNCYAVRDVPRIRRFSLC